jgi:chitin synthase
MVYCYFLTICIPNSLLKSLGGKKTREAQRAWREKVGIVSIVLGLMGAVGFLTFGFTQTVCGEQPLRIKGGNVQSDSLVINGFDYDLGKWNHPAVAGGAFNGTSNPLYMDQWMAGGTDASFLFQKVNQHCLNVITPAANSGIRRNGNYMAWYFPCNLHSQFGTSNQAPINLTGITTGTNCHTNDSARNQFNAIVPTAEIYYTWEQVRNQSRNLAVYKS